ncbi:MAG: GNAT family N-acetyltransferase [Chloroflexota bacterium]
MELVTSRLTLRDFRENDFALFRELESHPKTYRFESTRPDNESTQTYLELARADALQTPRVRYCFAATIHPDDEVRGRVTLTLVNESIREWEIGWTIHPDLWGQGFATEAAHRLLEFAFLELDAHRVVAFSHAQNAASLRVMGKLGMQREGLLRETRQWQGGWADEVVFSILEREWR